MNKKNRALNKWIVITVCCAVLAFVIPIVTTAFLAEQDSTVVIVLDPGHGGADMGAISSDGSLYESDLNLAITAACYEELQKYDGIEVYMTHSGVDYSRTMSLNDRINYVHEVDADILISMHCNDSVNLDAAGSEVYVSHSTYKDSYNKDSTELAISFLKQFRDVGLKVRGVKTRLSNGSRMYYHEDGTEEVGDYYAVIGGTIKKYGIPGILVEHGFVTGDKMFLDSPEDLKALGAADARAIVDYYGLKQKGAGDNTVPEEEDEAIIITDRDVASASDVNDRLVNIPAVPTAQDYDALQQLRHDYERLTLAGRTLVDISAADSLYKAILDVDYQMYPVRLVEAQDTELSINRVNHTVTGVYRETSGLKGTNVASLISSLTTTVDTTRVDVNSGALDDITIIVADCDGQAMDLGAQVGTGCCACLIRGDEIIDRLYVVIPCDLSGDGIVDSHDQFVLENHLFNGEQLSDAQLAAADTNCDGVVNSADINVLITEILKHE